MKQIAHDADSAGLSYTQMMENAGQAAATVLLEKKDFHTAAVFCGTGFRGKLCSTGKAGCNLINQSQGVCLSPYLPSGLNADTGVAAGGIVQADLTVTFHTSNPCHRFNSKQCGETKVESIGVETFYNYRKA